MKIISTLLISLISLLIFIYLESRANAIDLQTFINQFQKGDVRLSEYSIAKEFSEDFYETHQGWENSAFEATPYYRNENTEIDSLNDKTNARLFGLGLGYNHEFDSATTLSLRTDHLMDISNSDAGKNSRGFSLRLSQPIGKNGLGESTKIQRRILEANYAADNEVYKKELLSSCVEAAGHFIDLWTFQNKEAIFKKFLASSKKVANILKENYRKRYVNEFEYLRSETSVIKSEIDLNNIQESLEIRKAEMAEFGIDLSGASFDNPVGTIRKIQPPSKENARTSQEYIALSKQLDALKYNHDFSKQNLETTIDPYFELGRRLDETDLGIGNYDVNRDYVEIGVKFLLPVGNTDDKLNASRRLREMKILEAKMLDVTVSVQTEIETKKLDLELLNKRNQLLKSSIEKNSRLAEVALEEVKQAKREIDDYIRVQDEVLRSSLALIDYESQEMKLRASLFKYLSTPGLCGGKSNI